VPSLMASNKDLAALLPYVQSVCRGFCSRRRVSDPDAYESEAALALVEEGRKWAPGRGMGLKSFVRQRVVWRLLRFHKAELERQREFQGVLDPDEIPVDGAGEGRQWTTERLLALEVAMRDADLSSREEDVLLWLVVLGHTQREVAEEMGVSVTTVRRLRDAAVEKVRHHVPAPFDPTYQR